MKKMIHKNSDGFTLAELLIVVAIIAVLVAVSIPIFTRQLEKAREATDMANMRAAKAAFITAYLNGNFDESDSDVNCYYDAQKGILVDSWSDLAGNTYGRGTSLPIPANEDAFAGYLTDEDYQDCVIVCIYEKGTGTLYMKWQLSSGSDIGGDDGIAKIDPNEDIFYNK